MIAIVDYGVGNLYSLVCSLEKIGAEAVVTGAADIIRSCERVILPGVGAFGDAAAKLQAAKLDGLLQEQVKLGKPLMGICLGMQLLFEESHEYGIHKGLGLIPGIVRPLEGAVPEGNKVPHMGWNSLNIHRQGEPLLREVKPGDHVYYVHSYYATDCEASIAASSQYAGIQIPGLVRSGHVCGAQFHPEKSGNVGLGILRAFAKEGEPC